MSVFRKVGYALVKMAFLLFLAMIFLCSIANSQQVLIVPNHKYLAVGDVFTLDVEIANVTDLYGYQIDIYYDPNVLGCISVTSGSFLSNNGAEQTFCINPKTSDGFIDDIVCVRVGLPSGASGSGVLTTLQFAAVSVGQSIISLSDVKLADSTGAAISCSTYNATVQVGPELTVVPDNQAVTSVSGTTTFEVSNTGIGTMPWTAAVISGNSWLSIQSGSSGTNSGTITAAFTVNPDTSQRTGTIRVTATGAEGSPKDVTVTQAGMIATSILSVTPDIQPVGSGTGTTIFEVSNTGTGTMAWTAEVVTGSSWLSIQSGSGGTNSGTITAAFTENTGASSRTGTIRVTATGTTGSPKDVTVTQTGQNGLGEAVDNISLVWTSSGDVSWFGQPAVSYYGGDAAQSGDIVDNQQSFMQTSVMGPGELKFYWKVSSEGNYDFLEFYIDDVLQAGRISGDVDWGQKTYNIASGAHNLKWRYTKDGSVSSGSDAGWIDYVTFGGSPIWTTSKRLTWTSGNSQFPMTAVNSLGHINLVWHDNTPGNYEIYYKKSTNGGGSWSTNQRLTSTSGNSLFPVLTLNSSGHINLVWQDDTPGNMEIYYTKSTNGGAAWSPSQRLTSTSGLSQSPAIAVNSAGHIHVAWEDDTPGNYEIYYMKSTNGGASWSAKQRLTVTSSSSQFPAIAVDATGNIHVVWQDSTPGNAEIFYKKSTNGGATWLANQRLTWTSGTSEWPALAVNSSGYIHLLWHDNTPGNFAVYHKKSTNGGGSWSANQRLTWTSGSSEGPGIAVDSSDYLHVVWPDNTSGNYEIYYKKSMNGGGSWSASRRLTWTSGNSRGAWIAVDPSSALHVVWNDNTPGNFEVYYKKGQ